MRSLRHVTPPLRVYCGADSLQNLAAELDRLDCRRAVVFCGQTLAHHADGVRLVSEALGDRCAGVFDGVKAHTPFPAVLTGVEVLRSLNADAVIAVGGGSAVVTARASSILLAEARDIGELCTQFPHGKPPVSPRLAQPKLPQFVVATTPTTAYAKAGSAVLDPARGQRLALFDPKTRAAALFIHPVLALTAPPALASGAAVQAFCMAVQGIESRSRDPLADALLLHALRVLADNLCKLAGEPHNAGTREQLMLGALLAGQGSDYAPTGMTSALAHCVGARFHLDNGITNAVLLPHAMRFNAPATADRLPLVAEALGAPACDATEMALAVATRAVRNVFAQIGLPARLRDIGVPEADLSVLAADAATDWFLHQNPRPVAGTADILEVLRAAW
jgi:alcohol dehydrogenase class IV